MMICGRKYRSEVYAHFDTRPGGIVGVVAYQTAPFYSIVREYLDKHEAMDRKYGYGKLVELVPKEMAERFDSALYKLFIAIRRCPRENKNAWNELKQRAAICSRGLDAMEGYVREHNLYDVPDIWTSKRADGHVYGFVKDDDDLAIVRKHRDDLYAVWSLSEVMLLIDQQRLTSKVKNRLDANDLESKVVSIDNNDEEYFNDPVPF